MSMEDESSVNLLCQNPDNEDTGFQVGTSQDVEICTISDECFAIPPGYRQLYGGGRGTVDQEEELLQMAIQQSLMSSQSQQLQLEDGGDSKDKVWGQQQFFLVC